MVGAVIDAYLALLGALLAGVTMLAIIFIVAMAQVPTRAGPISTVIIVGSGAAVIVLGLGAIAVASALLTPLLVAAAAAVVLAAVGYVVWRLVRHAFPT
jgi:hypothetical protein